jgi:hypothetical protein
MHLDLHFTSACVLILGHAPSDHDKRVKMHDLNRQVGIYPCSRRLDTPARCREDYESVLASFHELEVMDDI